MNRDLIFQCLHIPETYKMSPKERLKQADHTVVFIVAWIQSCSVDTIDILHDVDSFFK